MKGVNLANALEAPVEGDWGVILEESYFDAVKAAGFTMVRIPLDFASHAAPEAPFAISDAFMNRVEEVLGWATARGLGAVLSFHSYTGLYREPEAHRNRYLGIWENVAKRFAGRYPNCLFEPLNEPHGAVTQAFWNNLIPDVVQAVRRNDPDRALVFGGLNYNDALLFGDLVFPEGVDNLIATFHYYQPYQFTHQGADWVEYSDEWLGREWTGSDEEMEAVRNAFAKAAEWSTRTGIPMFLGEFGCSLKADEASRIRWTKALRQEAESWGFGWAYWDFCAGMAIYDKEKAAFYPGMAEALIGSE